MNEGRSIDLLKLMFKNRGEPAKLKYLVGSPFLMDPLFRNSVVLLLEHGPDGTFGLIINKPISGLYLSAFFPDVPEDKSFQISIGGPVSSNTLFCLHQYPDIPNAVKIHDNLYFNGDLKTIIDGIIEGKYKPDKMRFFSGYSGWGKGQLKREMEEMSWIVVEHDISLPLKEHSPSLWWRMLRNMDYPTRLLSYVPDNPILN